PRVQEQPEQAGGLGIPALHQHREGRSRPAPGPGDPADLDGESRVRLRQDTARLPVDAGHAEAARAAGVLPPEVERAGDRLRRGGGGRALRQGSAQAAPGRSRRQDGSRPQRLTWRRPTWPASGGQDFSSSCPPWCTSASSSSSRWSNRWSAPSTGRCRAARAVSSGSGSTQRSWTIRPSGRPWPTRIVQDRSEEHTSELQSRFDLVCRLLLEKKKKKRNDVVGGRNGGVLLVCFLSRLS